MIYGSKNIRKATHFRHIKGITAGMQGKASQLFRLGVILLLSLWGECTGQSQSFGPPSARGGCIGQPQNFGPPSANPISCELVGEKPLPGEGKYHIYHKKEGPCKGVDLPLEQDHPSGRKPVAITRSPTFSEVRSRHNHLVSTQLNQARHSEEAKFKNRHDPAAG